MKSTVQLFISFIALVTFYFLFLVPFSAILRPGWGLVLPTLLCAAVATLYVWRRLASLSEGMANAIVMGALVTGGTGFIGGFFGPMIFAPGANQGPMLGIFITGPLGVLAGAIGGAVYWMARGRRADAG